MRRLRPQVEAASAAGVEAAANQAHAAATVALGTALIRAKARFYLGNVT